MLRFTMVALSLTAAALSIWQDREGTGPLVAGPDGNMLHAPYIPVTGDVPTIGFGSTRYEDGRPVRLTDPPITRERAVELANALHAEHEADFKASMQDATLSEVEFAIFMDFTGQYGTGAWRSSSMRRHILAGQHRKACEALLAYKFVTSPIYHGAGWQAYQFNPDGTPKRYRYDCSQKVNGQRNRECWGVWLRTLERHEQCVAEQNRIEWLEGTILDQWGLADAA